MGEKPKQPESFPIKIKLFKETDAILSEIKQELEGNSSKSTKRPWGTKNYDFSRLKNTAGKNDLCWWLGFIKWIQVNETLDPHENKSQKMEIIRESKKR